jgi:hypothetical protein
MGAKNRFDEGSNRARICEFPHYWKSVKKVSDSEDSASHSHRTPLTDSLEGNKELVDDARRKDGFASGKPVFPDLFLNFDRGEHVAILDRNAENARNPLRCW